ncbi:MAG: amidohydrolase family protein, partial [Acidimicrobiales bacterium]
MTQGALGTPAGALPLDGSAQTTERLVADVVVTMDAGGRVLRPGAVEVTGDRITWVGPVGDVPGNRPQAGAPATTVVGGLLMPGLVNTHGHSAMTLLRGAGDGLALDRWLRESIWPREARLTPEDVWWGMALGCAELLRAGVTTTCEQYLHASTVAEAALDAHIRCVLTPAVIDLPGADGRPTWQRHLDDAGLCHADAHGRAGLLSIGIGPHSAYALPEEGLVAVAKVAGELGALVHIHVAETRAEGAIVEARYGCSAPAALDRLGVLEHRVLAAHSVWLSDDDLALYESHDVAVAHCPQSNGKLGSGVARVADMRARGIEVGIGTDGPASNDNLDLWEELRLAPLLARATAADATVLGTLDALSLATLGGARALGIEAGSLEVGKLADLVRVDLEDPAFVPGISDADLLAHLVWAASSRLVTDVWVGGRRVVAGGACATVDEGRARRE